MGKELSSGKIASRPEGTFLMGRELPSSKDASRWEKSCPVRRVGRGLHSGMELPSRQW